MKILNILNKIYTNPKNGYNSNVNPKGDRYWISIISGRYNEDDEDDEGEEYTMYSVHNNNDEIAELIYDDIRYEAGMYNETDYEKLSNYLIIKGIVPRGAKLSISTI